MLAILIGIIGIILLRYAIYSFLKLKNRYDFLCGYWTGVGTVFLTYFIFQFIIK